MANLPVFIAERVPLAPLTTFGIGGPARFLARPSTREEAGEALALAARLDLPVLVLGGGSNLLVADAGVEAMVVRPGGDDFARIDMESGGLVWRVGAAAPLQALASATAREGIGGLASLAGIPGRVGGAVAMNAGAGEGGIGRFVRSAEVFRPDGSFEAMREPELAFAYRLSAVKGLLAVRFTMEFSDRAAPEALLAEMRDQRQRKRSSQPLDMPSAGCVFKNPPGDFAGRLLEQAGCKGLTEGGAAVSDRHANFIVNTGGASGRDVAELAGRMRDRVHAAAGIVLEPEIAMWGDDAAFARLGEPFKSCTF